MNRKAKAVIPVVIRSKGQVLGKELGSLLNMVSKNHFSLPFLFASGLGLGKLTKMSLAADDVVEMEVVAEDEMLNTEANKAPMKEEDKVDVEGSKIFEKDKEKPVAEEKPKAETMTEEQPDVKTVNKEVPKDGFSEDYKECVQNMNKTYTDLKRERWAEISEKEKKLTKEFEVSSEEITLKHNQGIIKLKKKLKKDKRELAKQTAFRNTKYRAEIKEHEAQFKALKKELNDAYLNENKQATEAIGKVNLGFLNKLQTHNKEYRAEHTERIKPIVEKHRELSAELKELEKERNFNTEEQIKFCQETIKRSEKRDKDALLAARKERKMSRRKMDMKEKELSEIYQKRHNEAEREFESIRNQSLQKFEGEHRELLGEHRGLSNELKELEAQPFREYLLVNVEKYRKL